MHIHVHDSHVQYIYWSIMWTNTYIYIWKRSRQRRCIQQERRCKERCTYLGQPNKHVNNAWQGQSNLRERLHTVDSLHEYKPSPSLLVECSHKPSYVVLQTPEQRPRALSGQLDHIQTLQRSAYQLLGRGSPLTPVGNLHNPRSLLTEPLSRGAEVAKGKNK